MGNRALCYPWLDTPAVTLYHAGFYVPFPLDHWTVPLRGWLVGDRQTCRISRQCWTSQPPQCAHCMREWWNVNGKVRDWDWPMIVHPFRTYIHAVMHRAFLIISAILSYLLYSASASRFQRGKCHVPSTTLQVTRPANMESTITLPADKINDPRAIQIITDLYQCITVFI